MFPKTIIITQKMPYVFFVPGMLFCDKSGESLWHVKDLACIFIFMYTNFI